MWYRTVVDEILSDLERLRDLQRLTTSGVFALLEKPHLVDFLHRHGFSVIDEAAAETEKQKMNQLADMAKREVNEGFPLLLWQSTFTLWAILESGIHRFLVDLLENQLEALAIPEIARLKVKIGEYEPLAPRDKYALLTRKLESELNSELKVGVNRFESLLGVFGLSESLPERLKKDMFELHQIRNNLAHRHGRVDTILLNSCPWLDLEKDYRLIISPNSFERYFQAVLWYVAGWIMRVIKKYRPSEETTNAAR